MTKKYITSFNALRCIGAVMIFLHHCSFIGKSGAAGQYISDNCLSAMGPYAVTLFFVIAGFFAYYTYKPAKFGSYIFKKLKRIYPLLMIFLLFSIATDFISDKLSVFTTSYILKILANVFLVKSFIPIQDYFYSFSSHTWFLSVIFWFWIFAYFFIPMIKKSRAWKIGTYIVCALSFAGAAFAAMTANENLLWLLHVNPGFNIFGKCAVGVIIAIAVEKYSSKEIKKSTATLLEGLSLLLFIAVGLIPGISDTPLKYIIFVIPTALLLLSFSRDGGAFSSFFKNKPMQKIGDVSFEIYIFHPYVISYFLLALGKVGNLSAYASEYWYITAAVIFAITVGVSAIYTAVISKLSKIKRSVRK